MDGSLTYSTAGQPGRSANPAADTAHLSADPSAGFSADTAESRTDTAHIAAGTGRPSQAANHRADTAVNTGRPARAANHRADTAVNTGRPAARTNIASGSAETTGRTAETIKNTAGILTKAEKSASKSPADSGKIASFAAGSAADTASIDTSADPTIILPTDSTAGHENTDTGHMTPIIFPADSTAGHENTGTGHMTPTILPTDSTAGHVNTGTGHMTPTILPTDSTSGHVNTDTGHIDPANVPAHPAAEYSDSTNAPAHPIAEHATSAAAHAAPGAKRSNQAGTAGKRAATADAGSLSTDTLSTHADTLSYPAYVPIDFLPVLSDMPTYRDTTARAVFGTESVAVTAQHLPPAQADSLTENAVFQSFVLLLAVTYAILLYRNLGDVGTLLSRISRDTTTGNRIVEDPGSNGFSRFLNIATTIGMLFMGVVVTKYGDSLMPQQLTDLFSHNAVLALSLLVTLVCAAMAVFQLITLRLIGAVTLSQPFISQLMLLKRTYFSLAVIISSPALLLFALCPRGTGGVWFFVVAAELAVTAILYLKEALNLFLSKKISILHWFLYLCGVEIFPISLLWLLLAR